MFKYLNRTVFLAALVSLQATTVFGANFINNRIAFQGILKQSNGVAVPDGTYKMQFTIHTGGALDSVMWIKNNYSVQVTNGIFSAILSGTGNVAPGNVALTPALLEVSGADFTTSLQVDVAVDFNGGLSGDGVYESSYTNIPIMAVPTAMIADRCNLAQAIAANSVSDSSVQANSITLGKLAASGATSGQVASWNGSAWAPSTLANFSGSLAGDVTGTQASTVVARLQGVAISASAPATGNFLKYNGTAWAPAAGTSYTGGSGININGSNVVAASGVSSTNMSAGDYSTVLTNATPYAIDISGTATLATSAATVSGTVAIANGGTGATSASAARINLLAATRGANSDITSLTALSTALSLGQGGTGAITAPLARANLSAAASGANSDITSLTALSTALSLGQGGTGANTAPLAIANLGVSSTAVVQGGSLVSALDTGAANAYVVALSPAITAYATGQSFTFKALNSNSGASTVSFNGVGAVSIRKLGGSVLASGDVIATQMVTVVYDGTNFQMQSQVASSPAGGITALTGDVTASGSGSVAATVATVGGASAASIAAAATGTTAATSLSTSNTIVKRDANGAFATGTGTVALGGATTVAGLATMNGGLTVVGTSTLAITNTSGLATMNGGLTVPGTSTLAITNTSGLATMNGGLTVPGTSTLAITNTSGLATMNGGLTVNGATSLNGSTSVALANTFTTGTGAVTLGGTVYATGAVTAATGVNTPTSATVGTNTVTIALAPVLTALNTGLTVTFKVLGANTTAVSLQVNATTAKSVYLGGAALTGGELVANQWVTVVYDGTVYNIISPFRLAGSASLTAAQFNTGTVLATTNAYDSSAVVTVAGAAIGDPCACSPAGSPGTGITWSCFTGAANSVTLRYSCNSTTTCTVLTQTVKCQVFK